MTGRSPTAGLTLDVGALIQFERGDERVRSILRRAVDDGVPLAVPTGVLAQAWRGGPRQIRIARLLADPDVELVVLDDASARGWDPGGPQRLRRRGRGAVCCRAARSRRHHCSGRHRRGRT